MHKLNKIFNVKPNFLPYINGQKANAEICGHCVYVNKTDNAFCTNCGYPLRNNLLIKVYHEKIKERKELLFKAENSVVAARVILYVMASFMLLGTCFVFTESAEKYLIVILALIMSGLFFFLAFWSRNNPFSAMLTSFIILTTFCAINIFNRLMQSVTTLQGSIGMILCIALLLVVLRGVQGAYRVTLMKQELQTKI